LKEALNQTSDNYWRFELALKLAIEEKSLDKTGGKFLNAYKREREFSFEQQNDYNLLKFFLERTKPVQDEVDTIKKIISEQPESEEKEKLEEATKSLEEKMGVLLHKELDKMNSEGQEIDLNRLERIATIGRYENWLKRNIVALVGSTLTFLAAIASVIVSIFV